MLSNMTMALAAGENKAVRQTAKPLDLLRCGSRLSKIPKRILNLLYDFSTPLDAVALCQVFWVVV